MDKLFNNHWVVRLVSLLIAIMLYTMVNMNNVSNQPGVLPDSEESTYTLNNVDVQVYYNEEDYEVVDMDETVNVELTGSQTSIMLFQLSRPSFEVYADLEGQGEGVHNVRLRHRDFPADLNVSISPRVSSIELQQQETISYPVDVQLMNEEETKEGYTLGGAEVDPEEVNIKAPQSTHEKIDTVRASVDVSGADEQIETESDVAAYDSEGNELDIQMQTETVNVVVPVESPSVQVPVNLAREGTLPDNLGIDSLNIEQTEATIYGPMETINDINGVEAVLDLSEIDENGTLELPVNSPEGIEKVEPETIQVEVEVGEREETVFEDVPIDVQNVPEDLSPTVINPEESVSNVTVYGSASMLEELNAEDISLMADWEDLEGDSSPTTLPVHTSGPTEVRVESDITEVEIEWSDETPPEESGNSNE
ncbi:CdaR family protein [Salibacterium salarium]|nr:CdaR family protein [Salibacterium salarium]